MNRLPNRSPSRFSLAGIFVVVFVLIAGLIWVGVSRVGRSFVPQGDTEATVEGLTGDASIVRDQQGIPYITASNEADAFAAIGYAHAQDRLWQMDLTRRAGEGRLSEIFGTATIGYDALLRTIGFTRVAPQILKGMPAATRRALEAYSRGVNAYISDSKGRLPLEFDALGYEPEPWKPIHSVLVGRLLGWELNAGFHVDPVFGSIRQRVDSSLFADLLPEWPSDAPTIIPGGQRPQAPAPVAPAPPRDSSAQAALGGVLDTERGMRELMGMGGSHIGSNAWAVAPRLSASVRAMLANDPHLAHTAPGRWYQTVMLIGGEHRAGVTIPGTPFIVIGRNDNIAWGMTAMMGDETDFYVERLDSATRSMALHDGRWEKLQVIRDTIDVKDSASIPIVVRLSRHGPLISEVHPLSSTMRWRDSMSLALDSTGVLARNPVAMRWTGADATQELAAFHRINRARNLSQFTDATRLGGVPMLVFIYADRTGRIATVPSGRVPVAPPVGRLVPLPGWDSRYNWRGAFPMDRLPRLVDPERGFVASANNRLANGLPYHISDLWEDPSRAQRIEALLAEGARFAPVDFSQMQSDVVSLHLRDLVAALVAAFPDSARQRPIVRSAIARLRTWNGSMVATSTEAAIAAVWFQNLVTRTYRDEMGPALFAHYVQFAQNPIRALRRHVANGSRWFDDRTTVDRVETRDEILRSSLSDALSELSRRFGTLNVQAWKYGTIHTLRMPHPFGRNPQLRSIVDVGPVQLGGSNTTLNNAEWDFNRPYEIRLGPSMRQVVDFGDTTVFLRSIVTTGTSGQPLSQFYSNQTILWSASGHVRLMAKAPEGTAVSSRTVLRAPGVE